MAACRSQRLSFHASGGTQTKKNMRCVCVRVCVCVCAYDRRLHMFRLVCSKGSDDLCGWECSISEDAVKLRRPRVCWSALTHSKFEVSGSYCRGPR